MDVKCYNCASAYHGACARDTRAMRSYEAYRDGSEKCFSVSKVGERLKGVVVEELDGKKGKKVWVRLGVRRKGKRGRFVYVNGMIRLHKEKGLNPRKVAIDKPVTVFVKEVYAGEGRLVVTLQRPRPGPTRAELDALRPLHRLVVGEKLEGIVSTVTPGAAFLKCGVGRPTRRVGPDGKPAGLREELGFLGRRDLPEDIALSSQLIKSDRTVRIIDVGDRLTVYVKDVIPSNGRFRLTLDPEVTPEKVAEQKRELLRAKSKWSRRRELSELEVGEEVLGEVVKVPEYGFIVDVGAKKNGLAHISTVSEKEGRYVENLKSLASVGEKLYVTVRGVSPEGRLSLAYVQSEKSRPRSPNRRERRRAARGEGPGSVAGTSAGSAPVGGGGDPTGDEGLSWDEPFPGLDDDDGDDDFEDIFQ